MKRKREPKGQDNAVDVGNAHVADYVLRRAAVALALDDMIESDTANGRTPLDVSKRARRAHEKWDDATEELLTVLRQASDGPFVFGSGGRDLAQRLEDLRRDLNRSADYDEPTPADAGLTVWSTGRPPSTREFVVSKLEAAGLSRTEARRRFDELAAKRQRASVRRTLAAK